MSVCHKRRRGTSYKDQGNNTTKDSSRHHPTGCFRRIVDGGREDEAREDEEEDG